MANTPFYKDYLNEDLKTNIRNEAGQFSTLGWCPFVHNTYFTEVFFIKIVLTLIEIVIKDSYRLLVPICRIFTQKFNTGPCGPELIRHLGNKYKTSVWIT